MKTMSVELQDPSMSSAAPKESPLRVLLATASSGSQGGGELYLVSLAQQLRTDGHQVEALLSDHSRMGGLAELLHPFAKVHRVPYVNMYDRPLRTLGSVLDRRTIARLTNQFRQIAPDIIHVNKQNLEDGLDLLLAARRSGLPHVTTIHITHSMASLSAIGGRLRDWVARRVLRKPSDHYLAIAESGHRELKDYLATDDCQRNVHLVHNGVSLPPVGDRQSMRRQWKCAPGDIILGCVARIEKQKNPLFMIDLLARLPKNVRLVWVGDGRLRADFEAAAARAGVTDRLIIEGWRTDARSRMAGFDIFVLPSQFEGLPLAVLEAMSAGLPCLVSDTDGTREALLDRECGRLLPPVILLPGWRR